MATTPPPATTPASLAPGDTGAPGGGIGPANGALANATYAARIDFVVDLAKRLHCYGTTAQRLEAAAVGVSEKLRIDCEPWASPTAMILTFNDPSRPPGASDTTRVIRLAPGDSDLDRLCESDRIAEAVTAGEMDLADGSAALRALDNPRSGRWRVMQVLVFGLVAAAVGGLLRLPWLDIATAGTTGLLLGLLDQVSLRRPALREASDAIAGMLAGTVTIAVASFIAPLNFNTVIIASLIVLLPGLSLTNAVGELTSQQLVSGTARFAGAVTTVLKLTIGTMLAVYVAHLVGVEPGVRALRPQPDWVEWVSLLLAAYAFAVLFRANRRDYPLVMAAAVAGYVISRYIGLAWGLPAGIFVSALVMTALGNAYARWAQRPGAVIRLPGIVMLVPGSASLRGLIDLMQQQDVGAGQIAIMTVLNILLALIGGLLFGNLLLPPRRNL